MGLHPPRSYGLSHPTPPSPSSSGKTTLCASLAAGGDFTHLCVSELLRGEALRGTPAGRALEAALAAGGGLPPALVAGVIAKALQGAGAPAAGGTLIDGFPLSLPAARALEAALGAPPDIVILLEAAEGSRAGAPASGGKSRGACSQPGPPQARARVAGEGEEQAEGAARGSQAAEPSEAPKRGPATDGDPSDGGIAEVLARYAVAGRARLVDAAPPARALAEAVRALLAPSLVWVAGRPGAGAAATAALLAAESGCAHLHLPALAAAARWREAAVAAAERAGVGAVGAGAAGVGAGAGARAGALSAAPHAEAGAALGRIDVPPFDSDAPAPELSAPAALALVLSALAASGGRRALLSGFPRSAADLAALEAAVGPLACVLHCAAPAGGGLGGSSAAPEARACGSSPAERAARRAARSAAFEAHTAPLLRRLRAAGAIARRSTPGEDAGGPPALAAAMRGALAPQLALLAAGGPGGGGGALARAAGAALGYHTLPLEALLTARLAAGGRFASDIARAAASGRTLPTAVALDVLRAAVRASPAQRFLILGFPRAGHDGTPRVHEQLFELEAAVGPVKGCVQLLAEGAIRAQRTAADTPGRAAALQLRLRNAQRETQPAVDFFQRLGKAALIDTNRRTPAEVFEAARPFLE